MDPPVVDDTIPARDGACTFPLSERHPSTTLTSDGVVKIYILDIFISAATHERAPIYWAAFILFIPTPAGHPFTKYTGEETDGSRPIFTTIFYECMTLKTRAILFVYLDFLTPGFFHTGTDTHTRKKDGRTYSRLYGNHVMKRLMKTTTGWHSCLSRVLDGRLRMGRALVTATEMGLGSGACWVDFLGR